MQSTHFIHGDSRPAVSIQPVYITTDKRAAAKDIQNATKEEILRSAAEKLKLLCDEEIKADLLKKLADLQKQISRKKGKEGKEIVEDLNNAVILETVCQSVEIEVKSKCAHITKMVSLKASIYVLEVAVREWVFKVGIGRGLVWAQVFPKKLNSVIPVAEYQSNKTILQ